MVDVANDYQIEPAVVATQKFPTARKGYDRETVGGYLLVVSQELRRLDAAVETERLEAARLRRLIDEARADGAAQASSRASLGADVERESEQTLGKARADADELIAAARVEAERIVEAASKAAAEAEAQLEYQAQTVRERLRDEVRRVRDDLAKEVDQTRRKAADEAALIRAGDDDQSVLIDPAYAEQVAARILEDAESGHREAIGALEREHADLESQTAALRLVHDSLIDGLAAARGRLREMLDALESVAGIDILDLGAFDERSGDDEVVTPSAIEVSAESNRDPVAAAVDEPLDLTDGPLGDDLSDEIRILAPEDESPGGEETSLASAAAAEHDAPTAELEWDAESSAPDDEQIEALFDRVVAARHGDPLAGLTLRSEADADADAEEEPTGAQDLADGVDADGIDDDSWGYLDAAAIGEPPEPGSISDQDAIDVDVVADAAAHEPADGAAELVPAAADSDAHVPLVEPDSAPDEHRGSRRRRVGADARLRLRAVFSSLGNADVSEADPPERSDAPGAATRVNGGPEIRLDPPADAPLEVEALVDALTAVGQRDAIVESSAPTVARKLKRALQEIENEYLDAQRVETDFALSIAVLTDTFAEQVAAPVRAAVAAGVDDAEAQAGAPARSGPVDLDAKAGEVREAVLRGWAAALLRDLLPAESETAAAPEAGDVRARMRTARGDAAEVAEELIVNAHAVGVLSAGRLMRGVVGFRVVDAEGSTEGNGAVLDFDDAAVLPGAGDGAAVVLVGRARSRSG